MPKITSYDADTTPTSDDLILTVNDPAGTHTNKKVTIGNLFRNVPDGSETAPGWAFASDQDTGAWYSPSNPNSICFGGGPSQSLGGHMLSNDGAWDFYGTTANGGGAARIRINADELYIGIVDDGPTHQNRDIVLYSLGNINIKLQPDLVNAGYAKTVGTFKIVDSWHTPVYEVATVTFQTGYPAGYSGGDWATEFFTPNYSRLIGPEDGYSVLHARPTPCASGGSRQLFWRFEKETAAAMKSEMDIDGYLNLQGGMIGDLAISGIATGAIVAIYPQGTTGATTYGYKSTGVNGSGTSIASAELTIANGNATLDANNYNVVCAKHMPGCTSIKIYRTTGGATQGLIGTITGPDSIGKWRLNDTGLAGGGETPETTNTTGKLGIVWCASFSEVANDPAAVANKAIIFAKDNGAGKTQLMVQMPTGVAQQIAIEA